MMSLEPTILLTGAAGFIGRHVRKALEDRGCVVSPLYHKAPKSVEQNHIICDLLHDGVLPDIPQTIDTVYHFAGQVWQDANCEKVVIGNLLSLIAGTNITKIIYASSCSVYGQESMDGPVDELAKTDPQSPYAQGKILGERLMQDYAIECGVDVCILRYFNPYGIGQAENMAVPSMIAKANSDASIEIFGDGNQIRDFIHIDDMSRATLAAVDATKGCQIFNIGSGVGVSINDLAGLIVKLTGSQSDICHLPLPEKRKALEVPYRVADVSKITKATDWHSSIDMPVGLSSLLTGDD